MMHVVHPYILARKNYDNEDSKKRTAKRLSHGIDQDEMQQQRIGKDRKR